MELSELTAYAVERYGIREQHNWADLPGLSVLCHPQTGKWLAVLMREWDGETGTQLEHCDLKCGREALVRSPQPYLTSPVRMFGSRWLGIAFEQRTRSEVVFRLFDQAYEAEKPHGYTFELPAPVSRGEDGYRETALPFAPGAYPTERVPERLREMRRLYSYGRESDEARAKNFYRQAVFMQDYEDDAPWSGEFVCYFPTYHDLTVRQLRGYFTWRTGVRRGVFGPVATSCAYIYLYELLNGVGAASPEDVPEKLRAFETGYLDAGLGDKRMRQNLRRWAFEYAVVHGLPEETARAAADPETRERDAALAVLKTPGAYTDEEVFAALCVFSDKKTAASPVLAADPAGGARLFSGAWRAALAYRREKDGLFTLCFGRKKVRRWYPLSNAVVYTDGKPKDATYVLNACRSFSCRNGLWQMTAYEKLSFDRALFTGFMRAVDAALRRYLKTGRYLKDDPAFAWAAPYIEAATEAEEQARREAARTRITIDLSGLDRIRRDAETTRDSLLTEEETGEAEAPGGTAVPLPVPENVPENASENVPENVPELPLDRGQIQLLRTLLNGGDAEALLRENHMMPSVTADFINEALYDEIGDAAVLCENGRLSVAEEYLEDLRVLLGE